MAKPDVEFEQGSADVAHAGAPEFDRGEAQVFARALRVLNQSGIPYVVGGAFAKHAYTGIWRDTKDLDVFLKPEDLKTALDALTAAGFETRVEAEHWLAKAVQEPYVIDLIFGAGHGRLQIDDTWFETSQPVEIAGVKTNLVPIEELVASKAYIADRYRFDGADVVHLIHSARGEIDWQRVLARLDGDRELLLWHLILFDFVYPGRASDLPQALMVQLFNEVRERWSKDGQDPKAFRGTLLDASSFAVDVADWGYEDQRNLEPLVNEEGEAR